MNGHRRVVLSCSPHDIEALAIGHLIAEGWIERPDDLHSWQAAGGGVEVTMDPSRADRATALHAHQTAHGCGLRHFIDCDPAALPRNRMEPVSSDVAPLVRTLLQHTADGGVHAAAWSDGTSLVHTTIDVARHCAVDRVIGLAALAGAAGGGLVISARVSGAMAVKAARARIGWIASRSVATTLAREICTLTGIALHERAGRAHG